MPLTALAFLSAFLQSFLPSHSFDARDIWHSSTPLELCQLFFILPFQSFRQAHQPVH
jgi:hypothetical protein